MPMASPALQAAAWSREMEAVIARQGASWTAQVHKYEAMRTEQGQGHAATAKGKGSAFLAKEHKGGFTICSDDR